VKKPPRGRPVGDRVWRVLSLGLGRPCAQPSPYGFNREAQKRAGCKHSEGRCCGHVPALCCRDTPRAGGDVAQHPARPPEVLQARLERQPEQKPSRADHEQHAACARAWRRAEDAQNNPQSRWIPSTLVRGASTKGVIPGRLCSGMVYTVAPTQLPAVCQELRKGGDHPPSDAKTPPVRRWPPRTGYAAGRSH